MTAPLIECTRIKNDLSCFLSLFFFLFPFYVETLTHVMKHVIQYEIYGPVDSGSVLSDLASFLLRKRRKEGSSSRQTNWNIYSASACLMDVHSKLQGDPNVNYLQRIVSRYLSTVLQFAILHVCTAVVWELALLLANYGPESQRSEKIASGTVPATIGRDATISKRWKWILDMHAVTKAEFLRR